MCSLTIYPTVNKTEEDFKDLSELQEIYDLKTSYIFNLKLQMEAPILAFPKFPDSFEFLVANLGKITFFNDPNTLLVANACGTFFSNSFNQNLYVHLIKKY